jgi:hypothetical protein
MTKPVLRIRTLIPMQVQQFDLLCEVQSDKASVEITSRYAGTIRNIYFQPGDIVKVYFPIDKHLASLSHSKDGGTLCRMAESAPRRPSVPGMPRTWGSLLRSVKEQRLSGCQGVLAISMN